MGEEALADFEAFRETWLGSVREGQPSTRDLGRHFAVKLVTQWIDASEHSADLVLCDGSGDGGIDIALLDTGPDASNDDPEESGHTWYLVQRKYGSAFAGVGTLLAEGQKVIDTLDGSKRSSLTPRQRCGAVTTWQVNWMRIPMHSAHPYRFQTAHRSNLKPPTVLTMPPTLFG